jgi:uncharacterized protein (UPF0212 family)
MSVSWMETYTVIVAHLDGSTRTLRVDANSPEHAKRIAREACSKMEWTRNAERVR